MVICEDILWRTVCRDPRKRHGDLVDGGTVYKLEAVQSALQHHAAEYVAEEDRSNVEEEAGHSQYHHSGLLRSIIPDVGCGC